MDRFLNSTKNKTALAAQNDDSAAGKANPFLVVEPADASAMSDNKENKSINVSATSQYYKLSTRSSLPPASADLDNKQINSVFKNSANNVLPPNPFSFNSVKNASERFIAQRSCTQSHGFKLGVYSSKNIAEVEENSRTSSNQNGLFDIVEVPSGQVAQLKRSNDSGFQLMSSGHKNSSSSKKVFHKTQNIFGTVQDTR